MTIGSKIQMLRKQQGLSQEQLADALGISRQAVSKWESEQSLPELDKLPGLSRILGASIDSLVDDALEPAAPSAQTKKDDSAEHLWFPFCMGLLAVGLLIAAFGWYAVQTIIPVCAGLIVQVFAIVFFEAFGMTGMVAPAARAKRRRFYAVAVWILVPIPVCLLVFQGFRLLPFPYSSYLPLIVSAVLSLGIAGLAFSRLRGASRA